MMNYPIAAVPGVSPELAAQLKYAKIRTSIRLLPRAATPKKRETLAKKLGVPPRVVLEVATAADLLRVKRVGVETVRSLHAAGVKTVQDLRYRNPENLADKLAVHVPPHDRPSPKEVMRWIECARTLPNMISY